MKLYLDDGSQSAQDVGSGEVDLHLACRQGDLDRVRYLVEAKKVVDLNAKDAHDSTPLYYAALCGHKVLCQYLLENGARCEDAGARVLYAALNDDLRQMLRAYQLSKAHTVKDGFCDCMKIMLTDTAAFADWELQVTPTKVLPVHSAIIVIRCPLLAALVDQTPSVPNSTKHKKRFQLAGNHPPVAVLALVEFLYTGMIDTTYSVAQSILPLARSLGLKYLWHELRFQMESLESMKKKKNLLMQAVVVDFRDRLRVNMADLATCVLEQHHCSDSVLAQVMEACDAQLVAAAEQRKFDVHRFLLCAHSDYFRRAFEGSFQEATTCHVTLPASSRAVAALCEWMYCDQWKDSTDADLCIEMIELASLLMMPRLLALMGTVLGQMIDLENVFDILTVSRFYQLDRLEETCLRVIVLQIEQVAEKEEWRAALKLAIQEEMERITQKGNVQVVDIPMVADMKKILLDHYDYLGEDDSDDDEESTTDSDCALNFSEHKEMDQVIQHMRSYRQQRKDKLELLDSIVQETLNLKDH